jgi:isocitrate dehydrogenase (NAD+)
MVMPNLYGDILTDEAAEIQGGVGTAGSANIGKRYSMFEAVHGSAPRMVEEGRAQYADPSSVLKAAGLMLTHLGYTDLGKKIDMALEVCGQYERKIRITGRDSGASGEEYGRYVLDAIADPELESKWQAYASA